MTGARACGTRFRGLIASASLKPFFLRGSAGAYACSIPRLDCLGLIEASHAFSCPVLFARYNEIPRLDCLGLIEASRGHL